MPSLVGVGQAATETNLTGLNATASVTVAAWVKPFGDESRFPNAIIFRQAATANSDRSGYHVGFNNSAMFMRIGGSAGSTDSNAATSSGGPTQVGVWAHYAWVFDDANNLVFFYRNGIFFGRQSNTRDMTADASCTTTINAGITGSLIGNVFDLQVLPDVIVPSADIPVLMNPKMLYQGVKGRWFGREFRQPGISGTIYDESGNNNNLTASATLVNCLQGEEPPYTPTYV